MDRKELARLVDDSERAFREAICRSEIDDEAAFFTCLSALTGYAQKFMAPEVVAATMMMVGADIASRRGRVSASRFDVRSLDGTRGATGAIDTELRSGLVIAGSIPAQTTTVGTSPMSVPMFSNWIGGLGR